MEYVNFVFNAFVYGLALAAFLTPITISAFIIEKWMRK